MGLLGGMELGVAMLLLLDTARVEDAEQLENTHPCWNRLGVCCKVGWNRARENALRRT